MAENFALAEATLEFADGKAADWALFDKVIPNNVVIFTTDTMRFKKGNGADLYADLPDGPSFAEVQAGSQELVDSLAIFDNTADDGIIFINNNKIDVSTTTLTSILNRITSIVNEDATQDADLDTVDSQNTLIDQTVTAGDDNKLTVVVNGKMSPGVTVASIGGVIVPAKDLHIKGVNIYTDMGLTHQADFFRGGGTYYVEVDGFHDLVKNADVTFTLTEGSSLTTISQVANNIFKMVVSPTSVNATVNMTAGATYNTETDSKVFTLDIFPAKPLVGLYGGTGNDYLYGVAVDSNDNIICAGYTTSEGQGAEESIVVQFDSSLNILARKRYGGTGYEAYYGVAVDSNDNIICVGYATSEGQGSKDALVVKFDSNLNILARKVYGGTGDDQFRGVVIDSLDNIICAGFIASEGQGSYDCLVVKFDSSLNILARKTYGGAGDDYFIGVAVDSNDNIICAGYTTSEGQGGYDALVVKFDSSLNILARKVYGGTGEDHFREVAVDSNGNIICVGYTASEGQGNGDGLVVKFDSSLNILARKVYGGTVGDWYNSIVVDSAGNIICAGRLYSSAQGSNTAGFLVKFDSSLNILGSKFLGLSTDGSVIGVAVDSNNNIIVAGWAIETTNVEAMVMKFPSDIPSGNYVSTAINTFSIIDDGSLTLADSALTLADSTLTLADSALTLANSALTLSNSNLPYQKDTVG